MDTLVFQNSDSVSENRKPTMMVSMSAWLNKPTRDWCSCELFICALSISVLSGSVSVFVICTRCFMKPPLN